MKQTMQCVCVLMLMASLVSLGAPAHAQKCSVTDADKTAVADALRQMYVAATVDDLNGLHRVTAPSFYAFDGGTSYDSIDSLMNAAKAYQAQGVRFVWKVTDPKVTIHCDDAWITYVNDGSIQAPGAAAPTPTKWLESAVLEKQDGAWKIVFFHSSRVPSPTRE
jgi:hypothetical protein